jgi:murein L,D-transpeptidase YafK
VKSNFVLGLVIFFAVVAVGHARIQTGRDTRSLTADKVLVLKGERRLILLKEGVQIREYHIALGYNPVGRKERQGDGRTPEGIYRIDCRNPKSEFFMALHISYPKKEDVERARAKGVSPGGEIMIHGLGNRFAFLGPAHRAVDWTRGCIAVTNEEIEEIWRAVPDGVVVEIRA